MLHFRYLAKARTLREQVALLPRARKRQKADVGGAPRSHAYYFRVALDDDGGPQIRAVIAGRMQSAGIRVIAGDRVAVEMSPDLTLGRVVYRF